MLRGGQRTCTCAGAMADDGWDGAAMDYYAGDYCSQGPAAEWGQTQQADLCAGVEDCDGLDGALDNDWRKPRCHPMVASPSSSRSTTAQTSPASSSDASSRELWRPASEAVSWRSADAGESSPGACSPGAALQERSDSQGPPVKRRLREKQAPPPAFSLDYAPGGWTRHHRELWLKARCRWTVAFVRNLPSSKTGAATTRTGGRRGGGRGRTCPGKGNWLL